MPNGNLDKYWSDVIFLISSDFLYIVACQAHPALIKIGPVLVPSFNFNCLLVRIYVMTSPPIHGLKS